MKSKTLFLKAALLFITVVVLFFNIFLFPQFPRTSLAHILFSGAMFISALLYYFTAWQAFVILRLVDKNQAFSGKTLKAIQHMKLSTFGMGISYLAFLPLVYRVADTEDAPGVMLIGLGIVLIPFVISVFVAILQALLQNAIDFKSENDLTV